MVGVGGALGSLDTGGRASTGVEGAASCGVVSGFPIVLGRYFLERANCRFHAATLMIPIKAQYTSKTGRLHVFLPSNRKNIAYTHGSLPPKHHFVHMPISPPTIRAAPA